MDTITGVSSHAQNIVESESRYDSVKNTNSSLKPNASAIDKAESDVHSETQAGPVLMPEDRVSVSDEGRQMAAQSSDGAIASNAGKTEDTEKSASEMAKEALLSQIEEIEKKLAEAQKKLALVQATSTASLDEALEGSEAEKAMAATSNMLAATSEAEAIQAEIKMLSQQLQTLYQQLMEMNKGGGGGGGMTSSGNTAGLGGASQARGGIGERISLTA